MCVTMKIIVFNYFEKLPLDHVCIFFALLLSLFTRISFTGKRCGEHIHPLRMLITTKVYVCDHNNCHVQLF